jgi:hypothetical protein
MREIKRGQITIFMIAGVILLLVFGGVVLLNSSIRQQIWQGQDFDNTQMNNLIATCTKEVVNDAISSRVDLQKSQLENFINYNMIRCTNDFMAFRKKGYSVNTSFINTTVEINDKVIAAYINYPVEIKKGTFLFKSDKFNYIIQRTAEYQLPIDQTTGKLISSLTITSSDGKMEAILPSGTTVLDSNNNPAQKVTITIKSNEYDKDQYGIVTPIVYEFTDGLIFNPPITLVYTYDDDALPELLDEKTLKISYYDKMLNKVIDLTSDVDALHNKITASVSHFTPYFATSSCGCLDLKQVNKELSLNHPKTLFDLNNESCIGKDVSLAGEIEENTQISESCADNELVRKEISDVGYNYSFKIKPSECGEDGICYVALVIVDDQNLLIADENTGDTS